MSETLISKEIIYSIEHITEMNITQIKTIEKTFTDVLLGPDESNKEHKTRKLEQRDNFSTTSNHQNNELKEIGDTLVEVLTSINRRALSTQTTIVPETQDKMIE